LLQVGAEADFCDNQTEEAFAQRLSVAIWKKVGRYVKVVVDATSEDLPGDCFELNEMDYRKLMRTTKIPALLPTTSQSLLQTLDGNHLHAFNNMLRHIGLGDDGPLKAKLGGLFQTLLTTLNRSNLTG
jgi:hypothetical protein